MNSRSLTFFAGLTFVLLLTCFHEAPGQEIIKIDLNEKDRPQLNIDIRNIFLLETSKESLLGMNGKVSFFNHRFYIINPNRFQQPTLFMFDEKGRFLRKTVQGKGPGEVIEPFAFTINEEDSLILLHDQAQRSIITYDLDLNYIRSERHPNVMIMDLYRISRDTMLIYHNMFNRDYKADRQFFSYTLYSAGYTEEKHLDIFVYGEKSAQLLNNPVSISHGEVLFIAPYDYNVYQLISGDTKIRYRLDFGKYTLTPNELKTVSDMAVHEMTSTGRRVGCPWSFLKTDDFLVFDASFSGKGWTFFHSLKKKKTYCLNDAFETGQLPDCSIRGITPDGLFYALVNPEKMAAFQKLSGQYKELKVDENDNPYIIFFKVDKP